MGQPRSSRDLPGTSKFWSAYPKYYWHASERLEHWPLSANSRLVHRTKRKGQEWRNHVAVLHISWSDSKLGGPNRG